MSVNRFRRIVPVLDPTMYQFKERLQLPDLSGIGKIASALQTSYDTKIPRPQHIQSDAPLVDKYFVKPVEDLKSKAVSAFKSGDTSTGINYMKQMEQFIYNAKQPGGAYNAFEDTYKKATDYIKRTTEDKDLGKDTKDFSINKSLSGFQTFDEAGNRREFTGYVPAKEVDLNDYFTKLTKDWAETEWVKGYQRSLNGQYFDQRTGKKVSKEEIVNSLRDSWLNNPDIKPYVQQLSEMYGEEEALKRVTSAINLAAEKEAFESETSKLVGNKEYDIAGQIRVAREKKKMQDEEETTTGLLAPFKYNPIPTKPADIKDGKVRIEKENPNYRYDPGSASGIKTSQPHTTIQYDNRGFNEMVKDPKMKSYFTERPGLRTLVEQFPATGMKPSEYNKMISEKYESMRKTTDVSLGYTSLGSKEIQKINSYMLGDKKDDIGAIVNHSVTLLGNRKAPSKVISSKELAENKDKITFYAKSEGGNGYYPGSIFGTYKKGKEVYNIVVEPISYEASEHYKGLKTLSQPTTTREETDWQIVNIPGQGKTAIKSKPVLKFNGNTLEDVDLEFYIPGDESGKTEKKLEGWNKETLQNLFEQTSPLMNADQIKTGAVIK